MGDQERPDMSDRPELEHGKRFDVRDEPADALESEGHAVKRYATEDTDEPPIDSEGHLIRGRYASEDTDEHPSDDDTEGHGHWKGG